MKTKKAIKRLNKARLLLSSVIEQYAVGKSVASTRDLLRAAVDSIGQAETSLEGGGPAAVVARGRARAKKQGRNLSAEGRKRLSLAAKKRWAQAKRQGLRRLAAV
jgi:hypothetical protein